MTAARLPPEPKSEVFAQRYQKRKELGQRILAELLRSDKTRSQLARETKIAKASMTGIINGARGTSPEQLEAIAKALKVSVDHLVRGEPAPTGQHGLPKPPSPDLDPPVEQWPPGLAEFLESHRNDPRLTKRVKWYLKESRFRHEPWVRFNEKFFDELTDFWVGYLEREDKSG